MHCQGMIFMLNQAFEHLFNVTESFFGDSWKNYKPLVAQPTQPQEPSPILLFGG